MYPAPHNALCYTSFAFSMVSKSLKKSPLTFARCVSSSSSPQQQMYANVQEVYLPVCYRC